MWQWIVIFLLGYAAGIITGEYLPADVTIMQRKVKIKNSPGAVNEMNTDAMPYDRNIVSVGKKVNPERKLFKRGWLFKRNKIQTPS